ncbi:MAG: flavoprotein [Elusimicrobiota bacterium]
MKILLGVTGSIAAYKSAQLASGLIKEGHEVKTIMTPAANEFITPLTFKSLTTNSVYCELFEKDYRENHVTLSGWGDLLVIAPATANTLAKITAGFADNILTSVVLDFTGPAILVPAMHENMWLSPAVMDNIHKLKKRQFKIMEPETGDLAGGKKGKGRMPSPEAVIKFIKDITEFKNRYGNS